MCILFTNTPCRCCSLSLAHFQFLYAISKVQLKMLQLSSLNAEQTVTIRCKNVGLSLGEMNFKGFKRGTQFSSESGRVPEVISDGCAVSGCFQIGKVEWDVVTIGIPLLQAISDKENNSVFTFRTKRPVELPITDIHLQLGRQTGEAVGVEFGPVCYNR